VKGMSHVETLYALKRQARGPVESQIEYRMAPLIGEVWQAVADDKGLSVPQLRSAGWRAIKVIVQEV
jgi:hypothetical protein